MLLVLVWVYLRTRSTKSHSPESANAGIDEAPSNNSYSTDLQAADQAPPNAGSGHPPGSQLSNFGVSASRNRKIHEQNTAGRHSPTPGHQNARIDHSSRSASSGKCEDFSLGSRGLVWATADRNYR
jgi:hypothetical protein